MAWKDREGIVLPVDVVQYFWMEIEVVGMVSTFSDTQSLEDAYSHVEPCFEWSISSIVQDKKACISFNGC